MDSFKIVSEMVVGDPVSQLVSVHTARLTTASQMCRKKLQNGPNYAQQVALCTNKFRSAILHSLISKLQLLRRNPNLQQKATTAISKYSRMMGQVSAKSGNSKAVYRKRVHTIPVHQSLKPSPERYNPRSDLRS